jgi:hypothetical protein
MIRVLVDENLSAYFAEGLHIMQYPLDDGIEVCSVVKEFGKGVADEEWIPKWGLQKGIFITQDLKITTRRQQAQLLTKYHLGAFFLDVPKNYRYWDKVKLLVQCWQEMVEIIKKNKRPFAFVITPRKMERMSL